MRLQLKKRRDKLFDENPFCHWCGIRVFHPDAMGNTKRQYSRLATIDHLDGKLTGRRGKMNGARTVLACRACNEKRGRKDQKNLNQKKAKKAVRRAKFINPSVYHMP